MKVFRIFYYTLMFAAWFYGQYSGSRIAFLLFIIQLMVLIVALCLNLWTIFSFAYVQTLNTTEAQKGQTVVLHLGIYNDKPFPFTHMKVHVEAPAPEECQDIIINLAPQENASFDFTFSLPYRGEFKIGMTRLDIQDLFGLFPMHIDMRWLSYYHQASLLVYPQLLDFTLPPSSRHSSAGQNGPAALFSSGQEEFSHLRPWVAGDNASRIHWKASMKLRSLSTRQYQDSTGENSMIFIDSQMIAHDPMATSDRIAECATALLHAHLAQNDCCQLCCGDALYLDVKTAFSLADFPVRHQWLALLPFRMENVEDSALRLLQLASTNMPDHIYVLGSQFSTQIADALAQLYIPAHYWLADPLDYRLAITAPHVQLASFHETNLLLFLQRQLGGDEL